MVKFLSSKKAKNRFDNKNDRKSDRFYPPKTVERRIMKTPASDSPAIMPEAAGTTYSSNAFFLCSMKRTMRAPKNIESEFQKGMTKESPIPIDDGMNLAAFGNHFSRRGMIMPTATPMSIAILAVEWSVVKP